MRLHDSDKMWVALAGLFAITLLHGLLVFVLACRRNRNKSGFSPLPPFLAPIVAFPCLLAEPTLVFSQTGFTLLRVLEAVVTAAMFVFISFLLDGVIPFYLADRVCEPADSKGVKAGKCDRNVTRNSYSPESDKVNDSLPDFPGFVWWMPYPVDQDSQWFRAEEMHISKLIENRDEIWCALLPTHVDPNLVERVEAVAIAEWDLVWSPHIDLHWVPVGHGDKHESVPNPWSGRVFLVPLNLLATVS